MASKPHKPYRYAEQWPIIAARLNKCKLLPGRRDEFLKLAKYHVEHKSTYQAIEDKTGVPWPFVATIHRRENPSFDAYLGNGQRLNVKTTIVPKGRGPFCKSLPAPESAFIAGACDALELEGMDKVVPPWPAEKFVFHLEPYNGLGYFYKGLPSPYIWGGTSIQVPGKYVADGKFDARVMDKQPGCVGILWALREIDPTIVYTRES